MRRFDALTGLPFYGQNSPRRSQAIAAVVGLGLTFGSVITGIVAVLGISFALSATGLQSTDAVQLLQSRAIQVGFLTVALLYLAMRGYPSQLIRFRVPSIRGAAWIVAIPVLTAGSGYLLEPLLAAVGIVQPPPSNGMAVNGFVTRPLLWLVVFLGWFVFAAPAEELLFRGVIQGRLRETFDPVLGIILAAVFFGLMHVPIAELSAGMEPASSFVETFVGGIIFGTAYERTGNLLVPSIAHAGLWTSGLII